MNENFNPTAICSMHSPHSEPSIVADVMVEQNLCSCCTDHVCSTLNVYFDAAPGDDIKLMSVSDSDTDSHSDTCVSHLTSDIHLASAGRQKQT